MDKITNVMERWTALQPLSGRDQEMLSRRFAIDFNYNSNHIEGNSSPDITIAKLSETVGINVAAVNKQIKQLTNKGYIQRSANGNWRLIVTPSI